MQKLVDLRFVETHFLVLHEWLFNEVLVVSSLVQIVFVVSAFLAAYFVRKQSQTLINIANQIILQQADPLT